MNWDNQNNQDPWGRKDQDEVSFDDLVKKFSGMFGKQGSSSNGSSNGDGNGFNFSTKKAFLYGDIKVMRGDMLMTVHDEMEVDLEQNIAYIESGFLFENE